MNHEKYPCDHILFMIVIMILIILFSSGEILIIVLNSSFFYFYFFVNPGRFDKSPGLHSTMRDNHVTPRSPVHHVTRTGFQSGLQVVLVILGLVLLSSSLAAASNSKSQPPPPSSSLLLPPPPSSLSSFVLIHLFSFHFFRHKTPAELASWPQMVTASAPPRTIP